MRATIAGIDLQHEPLLEKRFADVNVSRWLIEVPSFGK